MSLSSGKFSAPARCRTTPAATTTVQRAQTGTPPFGGTVAAAAAFTRAEEAVKDGNRATSFSVMIW